MLGVVATAVVVVLVAYWRSSDPGAGEPVVIEPVATQPVGFGQEVYELPEGGRVIAPIGSLILRYPDGGIGVEPPEEPVPYDGPPLTERTFEDLAIEHGVISDEEVAPERRRRGEEP